jgi:hypothetical protein
MVQDKPPIKRDATRKCVKTNAGVALAPRIGDEVPWFTTK